MEKTLEKDYAERLSLETKKVTGSLNNTNNKNISDIDNFLGKIQNTFIFAADIVLKTNFCNKNNFEKCKQQKWSTATTQIVSKCKKT